MFWVIKHPRARKAHYCEMCGRRIDPGEVYLRGAGFDGTAWTWRECAHCEAMRVLYDINDGEEYSSETIYEWTTNVENLAELRDAAGYRMRWRTRLGTLLPVPGSQ